MSTSVLDESRRSLQPQGGLAPVDPTPSELVMVFEIGTSFTPPLAVLRLRGELDLNTTKSIDWALDEAIEMGCALVGLDLAGVDFIDCSGIGALVGALHRLSAASAQLCVHRFSPEVARMMKLTGTDVLFGVCDLVPARP